MQKHNNVPITCPFATGSTHPLDGTTRNHFKEWLRNQKQSNHFSRPFSLNVFTIFFLFYHVYQFHALIYGLNFIWEFLKFYIHNENAPLKNQ